MARPARTQGSGLNELHQCDCELGGIKAATIARAERVFDADAQVRVGNELGRVNPRGRGFAFGTAGSKQGVVLLDALYGIGERERFCSQGSGRETQPCEGRAEK